MVVIAKALRRRGAPRFRIWRAADIERPLFVPRADSGRAYCADCRQARCFGAVKTRREVPHNIGPWEVSRRGAAWEMLRRGKRREVVRIGVGAEVARIAGYRDRIQQWAARHSQFPEPRNLARKMRRESQSFRQTRK
jgi:hypothetical protein